MTLSLKQKYIKTIPINRTRKLKETEARGGTKHAKTVQRGGMFGWLGSTAQKKRQRCCRGE